jgi:4'-phosphopantetheinyl transferase
MQIFWMEQSERDLPSSNEWLSACELGRLNGFRIEKRRAEWRLGRWTAKLAIIAYLQLPDTASALRTIEIRPAASGAPESFINGEPAPVSISISHSGGRALCAAGAKRGTFGCDVEHIEQRDDAFTKDFFTDRERGLITRTSADQRNGLVTLLWSAKESALKALRQGLRLDTREVEVALCVAALTSRWETIEVRYGASTMPGWYHTNEGFVRTFVGCPELALPIALDLPPFALASSAG